MVIQRLTHNLTPAPEFVTDPKMATPSSASAPGSALAPFATNDPAPPSNLDRDAFQQPPAVDAPLGLAGLPTAGAGTAPAGGTDRLIPVPVILAGPDGKPTTTIALVSASLLGTNNLSLGALGLGGLPGATAAAPAASTSAAPLSTSAPAPFASSASNGPLPSKPDTQQSFSQPSPLTPATSAQELQPNLFAAPLPPSQFPGPQFPPSTVALPPPLTAHPPAGMFPPPLGSHSSTAPMFPHPAQSLPPRAPEPRVRPEPSFTSLLRDLAGEPSPSPRQSPSAAIASFSPYPIPGAPRSRQGSVSSKNSSPAFRPSTPAAGPSTLPPILTSQSLYPTTSLPPPATPTRPAAVVTPAPASTSESPDPEDDAGPSTAGPSRPVTDEDDKRRRNTAASARFRAKKKLREQAMERMAREMTIKVDMLERKLVEMDQEVVWLRKLVADRDGVEKLEEYYRANFRNLNGPPLIRKPLEMPSGEARPRPEI
ncbi:hypothetical protein HDU96_002478 [Phlyctochytrium bullatum]|nr:hypothetical protein HDU96_002478 [Phlyctochytrium bullatum]